MLALFINVFEAAVVQIYQRTGDSSLMQPARSHLGQVLFDPSPFIGKALLSTMRVSLSSLQQRWPRNETVLKSHVEPVEQ